MIEDGNGVKLVYKCEKTLTGGAKRNAPPAYVCSLRLAGEQGYLRITSITGNHQRDLPGEVSDLIKSKNTLVPRSCLLDVWYKNLDVVYLRNREPFGHDCGSVLGLTKHDNTYAVIILNSGSEWRRDTNEVIEYFLRQFLVGEKGPATYPSRRAELQRNWVQFDGDEFAATEGRHGND